VVVIIVILVLVVITSDIHSGRHGRSCSRGGN